MRDGLNVLADLVERLEVGAVEVEDASLARTDGEGFDVDLSVHIPADAEPVSTTRAAAEEDVTAPDDAVDQRPSPRPAHGGHHPPSGPESPAAFGDRSVQVGATLGEDLAAPPNGSPGDAGSNPDDASPNPDDGGGGSSDDEQVRCRVAGCDEAFETEHGMKIHATKAHAEADGSGPSPHRDPERLREVYEAHDTFEEMTAALDVDVTAQTVRRSMMSLGIHDPDGGDSGASDDGEAAEPADAGDATADEPDATAADEGADGVDAAEQGGETADAAPTDGATDVPADGAATDATGDADDVDATDDLDDVDGTDAPDGVDASDAPDGVDATDGADGSAESDGPDTGTGDVDGGGERAEPSVGGPTDGTALREALPGEVDPEVLVTAVREASTLYQVQRAMGKKREEVQHLLAELDLLDLVTGRVATEDEREVSRDEVERRIVAATSGGDDPEDGGRDGRGPPAEAD